MNSPLPTLYSESSDLAVAVGACPERLEHSKTFLLFRFSTKNVLLLDCWPTKATLTNTQITKGLIGSSKIAYLLSINKIMLCVLL